MQKRVLRLFSARRRIVLLGQVHRTPTLTFVSQSTQKVSHYIAGINTAPIRSEQLLLLNDFILSRMNKSFPL
jgi:hypothetical protein